MVNYLDLSLGNGKELLIPLPCTRRILSLLLHEKLKYLLRQALYFYTSRIPNRPTYVTQWQLIFVFVSGVSIGRKHLKGQTDKRPSLSQRIADERNGMKVN
jgi:hypothetical protein